MTLEQVRRWWFGIEDRWFDWRLGIDTRGVVPPAQLGDPHAAAHQHATSYQAVWTRNLRVLLREAARRSHVEVFIDVGSGKGKACFYAAPRFRRVIGVEYAGELVAEARRNQQRAGYANVEFVHADAAHYDVPQEPALVFLFNPFDAVTLGHFLERNAARLRASGSLIAYANDLQRQVLEAAGFACVFREPARNISLWR